MSKSGILAETFAFAGFLVKLVVIAALLRTVLFAPFLIPSESMLPRLLIGDYLFVSKWNYGYTRWSLPFNAPLIDGRILARDPRRGDIVVFRSPGPDPHDVIKRVIGIPGDLVEMRRGQLFLNMRPIPKRRIADFVLPITANFPAKLCKPQFLEAAPGGGGGQCRYPRFRETLPGGRSYAVLDQGYMPDRDDTLTYPVPPGSVFVMGDNRDDSGDSRFAPPAGMGMVPMARIIGKAQLLFFSTDGASVALQPWTWITATRWRRIGDRL